MNKDEENKNLKSEIAKKEEEILAFWNKNNIFEKSENIKAPDEQSEGSSKKEFVFYDGPPFATGLPHYGHLVAGTIKDVIPRYQTMQGRKTTRRWGWDCHGLPIENLIEKELGLKSKKDIEKYGVGKFNEAAHDNVLRYDKEWKEVVPRTGRWVNMDKNYQTMDASYTESIWWAFKEIYDKKLIYEGFKSMHLCPRCETTLSNFEVNQGYKDIKDLSVTAKFELEDEAPKPEVGQGGTYFLAWTTTPWTLPGNVSLAVNPEVSYVKVAFEKNNYILAKERLETVFKEKEYKLIEELKGSELVGKSYKPVFDYYKDSYSDDKKIWKVYGADFVTTEDGTGIVHIASAFGSDDLTLAQKENLPIIHHVGKDGKYKVELGDLAGLSVKSKDDPKLSVGQGHQATDIVIIKLLAVKGALFSKEKIEHSYPHCWRCDTPLLNYATSSWFLKVTELKDKLIEENQKINWVPDDIKSGRFGKWLEGSRDWAISRSRYWGAPLPVWKCEECEKVEVIGSVEDIQKRTKSTNKYFVMRHGEAESNVANIANSDINDNHVSLTEKGRGQALETAKNLVDKKIDLIIVSPFLRTQQTAEIVAEHIGLDKENIIFDERLKELQVGEFHGRPNDEYHAYFESLNEKFTKTPADGENLIQLKNRMMDFLSEIDKKYIDKNVLIVSHQYPIWMLLSGVKALDIAGSVSKKEDYSFNTAEMREVDYAPVSHNQNYELDLHRPYIDAIDFKCECGGLAKKIPEVFDCWFESGSMPYASHHYPFENLDKFNPEKNIGFPADFISEGLDQTRGWFYTLLVLSTALFGKAPYKNVIVNGMVLAEDGQKMSKRLSNYPDVSYVLDKYGADALRFYLLSSPLMKAEAFNFSEKGVDEVLKKVIIRLKNVVSFYELYASSDNESTKEIKEEKNVLDLWILARLNQLGSEITKNIDSYELDKASRPIAEFIDDLSTWYLRRSRDRFKGEDLKDKNSALMTTRFVLLEVSKLIAPFMPFIAEDIYQKIKGKDDLESVHLEKWPTLPDFDSKVIEEMEEVRKLVSLGLEARAKEGIKVRQPLQQLKVKNEKLKGKESLLSLIKDEMNVKEVLFDSNLDEEVMLNTEISPELKQEGMYRDLLRNIQGLRKKTGLTPDDVIKLQIKTSTEGEDLINKFETNLKKTALISEIIFGDVVDTDQSEEIKIDDLEFRVIIL